MTQDSKKNTEAGPENTAETEGSDQLKQTADAALGEEPGSPETYAGDDALSDNAEALAVLAEGLKDENAELKDKYLRLAAEMDNLRRRTARDVKDARAYAVTNFARDMLAVSDNLRRALDAIPAEPRDSDDAGFRSLVEGVEMTERAMLTTLEHHGVRKQEPEGQKFDPNFHQAMFEVPNADLPNNTVVQVVQDGYVIGERVLRPAMVGLSKGGPKQPAEPAPEGEGTAPEAEPDA